MRRLFVLVVSAVIGFGVVGVPAHVVAAGVPEALDARSLLLPSLSPGEGFAKTVALPWRANMIGISFLGDDPEAEGLSVHVNALSRGEWSGWKELHVDPDEQPERAEMAGASPRLATLPQWVGAAKRLEIRLAMDGSGRTIHDVRLEAMNTNGDAVDRHPIVAAFGAIGRFLTAAPATSAEAAASKPKIISRAQWGADESLRSSGPGVADRLVMAHVHHTVNSNSYSKSDSAALVRGIYRYHTKNRGYSDIGYNFLIDRYGQIFEGRYGGIEEPVIGGHAAGFNTESTGIALIGTFTSASAPSGMIGALKKLLAWKLDVHHVKPVGKVLRISGGSSRYDKGEKVYVNRIAGHRETSSTSCPGGSVANLLPSIRDAVNKIGHPKIYFPSVSHSLLRLTGIHRNAPFSASASFSKYVAWRLQVTDGAGNVVLNRTGKGRSMATDWWGVRGGDFVPTGKYAWRLTAANSAGSARPASGSFWINSNWTAPFWDEDGSPFEADIHAIYEEGITGGCGPDRFCPLAHLTRGEMAAFLARAAGLPPASKDYFSDDDGSMFEDSINRVAEAKITSGCAEGLFCPDRTLTRGEMAVFLSRAMKLPPSIIDHFSDDDGIAFEPHINRIADRGITGGCGGDRYCPDRSLTRHEMAAFLARAFIYDPAA